MGLNCLVTMPTPAMEQHKTGPLSRLPAREIGLQSGLVELHCAVPLPRRT